MHDRDSGSSMRNRGQSAGANVCYVLEQAHDCLRAIHRLLTLVRKEIRRYLRIWTQTLLPSRDYHVAVLLNFRQPNWIANR